METLLQKAQRLGIQPNKPQQDENALLGFAKGVGKGALSTATNLGVMTSKLASHLPGKVGEAFKGGAQYGEELLNSQESPLAATNTAQKLGKGVEQVGEFFIPGGSATKLTKVAEYAPKIAKFLPEASRIIGEAIKTGTISSAQEGDAKDFGLNSLVSLGLSGAGKATTRGLRPIQEVLSEKVPGRILNSIIKPGVNDFTFGKDPGKAVVKEGITGKSLNDLFEKIKSKKQSLGKEIDSTVSSIKDKTIDLSPIVGKIDDFISSATEQGEQTLVSRLQNIKNGLTKTYKNMDGALVETGVKNLVVTPKEAWNIKRKIGEATKWTNQAFDAEANQARVSVYTGIAKELEKLSPELKNLNSRYANLLTAQKAAERRVNTAQRLQKMSFGDWTSLGAGAAAAGPVGAAVTYAGRRIIGSTPVQTNIAQILSKLKPSERSVVEKILPSIQKVYLGNTDNEQ